MSVKPQSHLINILKTTRDHHPNFVLFLGAGASATSGVKLGSDMITEWRKATFEAYCPDKTCSYEDYLKTQHWYGSNDEYSILFEKLYDQPSQRREYIETCIKTAKPSWGYIYLVNLFLNRIFNTTFTTNFDDLLNEACYMFSSAVRPMVCAHDSSIRSVRITSQRPKIIKIHGDFLYDNIKNTLNELESLEQNTAEKFKQYAAEFGFIFIGYSGKDRSVMDTLNNLLKFDHFFPHGIYWCVRDPENVSDAVKNLCRFNRVHLIKIDGFDEIFADIHEALQIKLQPEMSDPYSALASRLNDLLENIKLPSENAHKVIERDIKKLGHQVAKMTKPIKDEVVVDLGDSSIRLPIPFGLLSRISHQEGKDDQALEYSLREIKNRPQTKNILEAFGILKALNDPEKTKRFVEEIKPGIRSCVSRNPTDSYDITLRLIELGEYDTAGEIQQHGYATSVAKNGNVSEEYYRLNMLQIKRHKGESYTPNEIAALEQLSVGGENNYSKAAALTLLSRYNEAEALLVELLPDPEVIDCLKWPIFKWLIPELKNSELKSAAEGR